MLKSCVKCCTPKPATEFYASARTNVCRECYLARCREYRLRNIDVRRAVQRALNKSPKGREWARNANRRKRAEIGPAYSAAHQAVRKAIASGAMIRPSECSACGKTGQIHAHHDDHERRLDVMWLCPACHSARHVALGRGHKRKNVEAS